MKKNTPIIIMILLSLGLAACEQKETIVVEEKIVTPQPTATPKIYALGEERPIVLNSQQPKSAPSEIAPVSSRTPDKSRQEIVDKLRNEANESRQLREAKDKAQLTKWEEESRKRKDELGRTTRYH